MTRTRQTRPGPVGVRIPPPVLALVDGAAKRAGVSRGQWIADAVAQRLAREPGGLQAAIDRLREVLG